MNDKMKYKEIRQIKYYENTFNPFFPDFSDMYDPCSCKTGYSCIPLINYIKQIITCLSLSQTTNFTLFQIESVRSRQF